MRSSLLALAIAVPSFLSACDSAPKSSSPPRTAAEQIEHGGKAYAANCARCHGDAGQGTKKAPPVVGAGALPLDPRPNQKRTQRFHTALDVAQFVTQNMPPDDDDRKKIAANDYWAVLAFDLKANGVELKEPVGPANAAAIVLHP